MRQANCFKLEICVFSMGYSLKKKLRSELLLKLNLNSRNFGYVSSILAFSCLGCQNHYPVLFRGVNGTVAHEFIVDLRGFKVVVN